MRNHKKTADYCGFFASEFSAADGAFGCALVCGLAWALFCAADAALAAAVAAC